MSKIKLSEVTWKRSAFCWHCLVTVLLCNANGKLRERTVESANRMEKLEGEEVHKVM